MRPCAPSIAIFAITAVPNAPPPCPAYPSMHTFASTPFAKPMSSKQPPSCTTSSALPAHAAHDWGLQSLVKQLRHSREVSHNIRHRGIVRELPSMQALRGILADLAAALFPTHYGTCDLNAGSIDYFVGHALDNALNALAEQVRRSLRFVPAYADPAQHDAIAQATDAQLHERALALTAQFAQALPAIRNLLVSDVQAAYQGDPAANHMSEVLLCYPGMRAITYHRMAHMLYRLDLRFLARMIASLSQQATGIDIHPAAQIDECFFIDHGTGVVIGETTIIGKRVRLYQQVTLGAKRFVADAQGVLVKGLPRHPIVEDDVVIYAGATILGRVTIGAGSVIGGNVWVTQDVPPGSAITQAQMCSDAP